jgi:hypothetical protein
LGDRSQHDKQNKQTNKLPSLIDRLLHTSWWS